MVYLLGNVLIIKIEPYPQGLAAEDDPGAVVIAHVHRERRRGREVLDNASVSSGQEKVF